MRDAKESTPRISCSERVEPDVPVRSRSSYIGMCPSGKLEARPNPPKIAPCKTAAPEGGCFNIRYDAEVSKKNSPSHLTYREKLLRFLFHGRQFGQQESDQENDRRTENYCKVGMQRTAQAIERRALVDKR